MLNMKYQKNIYFLNYYIFYLLPISIIFSNFLTNLIVLYFSLFGIYQIFKNKDYIFLNNFYVRLFIFFCLFISLNSLIFTDFDLVSLKSSFLFIRYIFFIYAIYILYKNNKKIFENFFIVYLVILSFLFIDSNYQLLNNGTNLFHFNSYTIQTQRISSLFFDELILGSYVQKFSILFTCYYYIFNNKSKFIIPIVLIITLEICLISGERLALFTIIIFCLIYFFLFMKTSIFYKIISIFFISILITTLLSISPNTKSRVIYDTLDSLKSSNFTYYSPGHKKHFDLAMKLFSDKPITGHGSNKFRKTCEDYQNKYQIGGCSTHPHNLIAQFLSEKGIVGILFLLTFYLLIIKYIIRDITNKDANSLSLLLISILLFYNPFFPSANFYNSWVNNIIIIVFSYLIILNPQRANDR
jgi:O-antigen ligase